MAATRSHDYVRHTRVAAKVCRKAQFVARSRNSRSCPSRQPYSIIVIVSLARRARSAISRLRANVSVEYPPCLRAFLLPLGAPPPAPWTRQTASP